MKSGDISEKSNFKNIAANRCQHPQELKGGVCSVNIPSAMLTGQEGAAASAAERITQNTISGLESDFKMQISNFWMVCWTTAAPPHVRMYVAELL